MGQSQLQRRFQAGRGGADHRAGLPRRSPPLYDDSPAHAQIAADNNYALNRPSVQWPPAKAKLEHFEWQQAEAEKRDHRRLGKQLGLFHFVPTAPGRGAPARTASYFCERWGNRVVWRNRGAGDGWSGMFSRLRWIELLDPLGSNAMEDGHEALCRSGCVDEGDVDLRRR